MGRLTLCESCRREHNEKPPCVKTGKPCKEVEAFLAGQNRASNSISWRKIALIGGTEEIEGLLHDKGL